MKRTMAVLLVTLAVAMAWGSLQAYAAQRGGLAGAVPALIGPAEGRNWEGQPGRDRQAPFEGRPGMEGKRPIEGRPPEGRPPMPPGQGIGGPGPDIGRVLFAALMAPWARENAEVQQLIDKLIADRKVMIQSENSRMAAIEQAVAAGRRGDEEAFKKAMDAVKSATDKLLADSRQVHEDMRALEQKLRELRPEKERRQPERNWLEGPGPGPRPDRPKRQYQPMPPAEHQ